MSRPRVVAVYVSAHGFGHAVRSGEVIRALVARGALVHVRSTAPALLFPEDDRVTLSAVDCDVGMAQATSLRVDLEATLARLDALESDFPRRIEDEARWLASIGAEVVLGDVPPLAFAAAARASVESFALANFSWDWVYAHYAADDGRFARHAARAARCYAECGTLLRLPLHAEMPGFSRAVDVPLVAPRAPCSRAVARDELGLPSDRPVVVLSFTGPGLAGFAAARLAEMRDVLFVTATRLPGAPENVRVVERAGRDYPRLLAAADAVVTKPGYGIVASCLATGVRVLCARREDFPESPVLEAALERYGTATLISEDDLLAVRFRAALTSLLGRPAAPVGWPVDGARVAADLVLAGARR